MAFPEFCKSNYKLPFSGLWFVGKAGDTLNVNHHMAVEFQHFGIDFIKVGGSSSRELWVGSGEKVEDYFGFGAEVCSPVDGKVLLVENSIRDNEIGETDTKNPGGNYILIEANQDEFVFLAHFKRGSIMVSPGQMLASGQILGQCGNSGNSTAPHIHMHVQNSGKLFEGSGLPVEFSGIDVTISMKRICDTNMPLLSGMFVENSQR